MIPPSEYQDDYWNRKRLWRSYLLWLLDLGAIFDVRDENITRIKNKWKLIVAPLSKRFRFTESRTHRLMETVFNTLWQLRRRRREITFLQSKGAIIEDYDVKKRFLDELKQLVY
jgi:hypothetical protein